MSQNTLLTGGNMPPNFWQLVRAGYFNDCYLVNKLGKNTDIDTGVIEDIWDNGGLYTGFPRTAPERVTVSSTSGSDNGTIRFFGLQSEDSEFYTSESVAIGATSVNSWYRIHSAFYNDNTDQGFNLGEITIAHETTAANVFITIPEGRSQSNVCAYTIPANHRALMVDYSGQVRRGTSNTFADGAFWIRTQGSSPRLRRPFTVNRDGLNIEIIGGLPLGPLTDIMPRILAVANNNLDIVFGMSIFVWRN